MRILLIRSSAVGDVVNTLPALSAIRTGLPDAWIGYLVEDRAADLIVGHPALDRVHLYPRRRWSAMAWKPWEWPSALRQIADFLRGLRRERYDIALDFQSNFKGAVQGLLSGARRRVGFSRGHCKELNFLFNNVHVTPPGIEINRVEKFLSLASYVGGRIEGAVYRLPESMECRARVSRFLANQGLSSYLVLHPGTSEFGKAKRWPPDRFAEFARRMGSERGLRSVVTWGPGERPLADAVVASSGGHAVAAMETRSLLDLAEIIRRSRLYVGCDSGPLHLASAVGTPSVALFGPKNPKIYGPYNPRRRIVSGQNGSMGLISVESAWRAAEELLEPGGSKLPERSG